MFHGTTACIQMYAHIVCSHKMLYYMCVFLCYIKVMQTVYHTMQYNHRQCILQMHRLKTRRIVMSQNVTGIFSQSMKPLVNTQRKHQLHIRLKGGNIMPQECHKIERHTLRRHNSEMKRQKKSGKKQ